MGPVPLAGGFPAGEPIKQTYATINPAVFAADARDLETGELRSVAHGVDPIEAQIVEAFRLKRESGAAVGDVGNRFDEYKFVTDHLESDLKAEVQFILRRLLERGDIYNLSTSVVADGDTANLVVVFRRRWSSRDERKSIPLLTLLGGAK